MDDSIFQRKYKFISRKDRLPGHVRNDLKTAEIGVRVDIREIVIIKFIGSVFFLGLFHY